MVFIDEGQLLAYIKGARNAFENGAYENAYKDAQSALNLDPTNYYARKILAESARRIRKIRATELKKRKKLLQPLWDEKKYETLLVEYQALNQFYPGSLGVIFAISILKHKIRSQREREIADYKKKIKALIHQLHKEKKYLEAIQALESIAPHFDEAKWIEELGKKAKHDYVISQLREQKKLLDTQEYEKMYRFLTKLYALFPEPRVKKYIQKAENLIVEKRKYDNRVFIDESLDMINAYFNRGEYESCMRVCEELMGKTGDSILQAKIFYARAEGKNEKEMNRMIRDLMQANVTPLEIDFRAHREEFVAL